MALMNFWVTFFMSSADMTAEMTAMVSVPDCITISKFSIVIPPMAVIGMFDFNLTWDRRGSPTGSQASGLLVVLYMGPIL